MKPTKEELRQKILFYRKNLSTKEVRKKSELISSIVLSLPAYKSCESIFVYIPDNKGEVDTMPIIHAALQEGKQVWIPRVNDDDLIWHLINEEKLSQLKPNKWGIQEPLQDWEPRTEKIIPKSICIVPGIAFDRRGYRIGHGKGYFDRFLMKNEGCISIGICYKFQLVPLCPHRNWDIPMDWIVSEGYAFNLLTPYR
ncbi:MAG TPA: 5-formyltetrahydrofolate cyclo-ligase [Candidatus Hydrogenedens sp.]|nr:5-formyltetrahydrofolate cyclo-ligase [Candidatus Hydrogenedens sp.]